MDEYILRNLSILLKAIDDYRNGLIRLNALINRIEEVSDVIGIQSWKDAVFPIILELEQVNSVEVNTGMASNDANKKIIAKALGDMDDLITRKSAEKWG
jgi:hypothetical protein